MGDLKLSCVIGPYVADFPQQNSSVSAINSNTSSNEVRRVIAEKIPLLQTQTTAPPSLPSLVRPLFSRRLFLFPSKIPEKTFTWAGGPGRGVWNIYEPPDRGSWILDCCPCCHLAARAEAAASEPSRDRGFKRPLGSPRDGEAALWSGHSGEERIVHCGKWAVQMLKAAWFHFTANEPEVWSKKKHNCSLNKVFKHQSKNWFEDFSLHLWTVMDLWPLTSTSWEGKQSFCSCLTSHFYKPHYTILK